MRRRGPGAAGLMAARQRDTRLETMGEALESVRLEQMQEECEAFRDKLATFAQKHKSRINLEPDFRNAFHDMCSAIGVDPLLSNKGFWAELLGVGNFYSELGVQILTTCLTTRDVNGGILAMAECIESLRKARGANATAISEQDVARAITGLRPLGGGVQIKKSGAKTFIVSVPEELNGDQNMVLEYAPSASPAGCVSLPAVMEKFGWPEERARTVLAFFVREGLVWVDDGAPPDRLYWFPSLAL